MKTQESNTIVAFKIGRGGRFLNQGHRSFIGTKSINEFTDDLFWGYPNVYKFEDRDNYDEIVDLITDEKFDELEEKFGIKKEELGEYQYYTGTDHAVGLTYLEAQVGIGSIDIDGDYNTVYTKHLHDCDENEIKIILESNDWDVEHLKDEIEQLGLIEKE